MSTLFVFAAAMIAADPSADQTKLLRVFRREFVQITPGKGKFPKDFVMGGDGSKAEQPAHKVTFGYDFAVARYEVPQNLWAAVMGENPSRWKGDRNSVEELSFDDAVAFCRKSTALMRAAKLIKADEVIRLPSEAEWEYCARAGTKTRYSFGDKESELTDYAWYTGNASGNDPPVGAKKPNAWGLYDFHGYLWEWCADVAHDDYRGAPIDGSAWLKGGDAGRRVIRGGSWKDKANLLTSSRRDGAFTSRGKLVVIKGGIDRKTKDDALGLRCVLAKEKK